MRGSSPRMRGAPIIIFGVAVVLRIIPADAGSTDVLEWIKSIVWDHPRGCGEHMPMALRRTMVRGSSPRMRGAHSHAKRIMVFRGIIPADAGSTRSWPWTHWPCADHPRGCGEHNIQVSHPSRPSGSSPRMRGAHSTVVKFWMAGRIIPADAGSTPIRAWSWP